MNTAPCVLDVLLAITFTVLAQMNLAGAPFPQTFSRGGGR